MKSSSVKNKPTELLGLGLDKKQISAITKALGTIGAIADKVTQPPKQSRMRMTCKQAQFVATICLLVSNFYTSLGNFTLAAYYAGKGQGVLDAACD